MSDMDAWGYSFRLGTTKRWFSDDSEDARDWLRAYGLVNEGERPVYRLRGHGLVNAGERPVYRLREHGLVDACAASLSVPLYMISTKIPGFPF